MTPRELVAFSNTLEQFNVRLRQLERPRHELTGELTELRKEFELRVNRSRPRSR